MILVIDRRTRTHTREKAELLLLQAIAPLVMLGQQRKKNLYALVMELCEDLFLETVPRLDRKPLPRSAGCNRLRRRACLAANGRSSAIATAH